MIDTPYEIRCHIQGLGAVNTVVTGVHKVYESLTRTAASSLGSS